MKTQKLFKILQYSIPALLIGLVMNVVAPASGQGSDFDLMGGLNLEYDGMLELEFNETSREISSLKVDNNVKLNIPSSNLKLDCDLLMLDGDTNVLIATGKVVNMEAQGYVATSQRLEYYLDEGKFVLTGKRPTIEQKDENGKTLFKTVANGKEGITLINKNGNIKMISQSGTIIMDPSSGAGALGGDSSNGNSSSPVKKTPTPKPSPEPTPQKTPEPSPSGGGKSPVLSE
jgi:hypothetical protein